MNELSPDQVAVEAVLQKFFSVVSFPPGGSPEYEKLAGLFSADGRLIRASAEVPLDLSVSDFIVDRRRAYESGELTSFHEAELSADTEIFGRIAHRLSVYEKRGVLNGAEFRAQGVISAQFIQIRAAWKISSMAWDDEREGLSIAAGLRSEHRPGRPDLA